MHGNGRNAKWAVRSIIKVYVTVFQCLYRPPSELCGFFVGLWKLRMRYSVLTPVEKMIAVSNARIVLISRFRNLIRTTAVVWKNDKADGVQSIGDPTISFVTFICLRVSRERGIHRWRCIVFMHYWVNVPAFSNRFVITIQSFPYSSVTMQHLAVC